MRKCLQILAPGVLAVLLLPGGGCVTRAPHDQLTCWIASETPRPPDICSAYHLCR